MAGKKAPNESEKKSGAVDNSIQRGTQNEMEILGLIITQNVALRQLVFDRLRQAKGRHETRQALLKSRGGSDDKVG